MRYSANRKKDYACRLAWHFIGTFYTWKGDDPSGFDCSGFVIEILKSVGIVPRKYDNTARGLYEEMFDKLVARPYKGCLVFFGEPIVSHVEFCIDNEFSIGASGGGKATTTIKKAIEQNAFIKLRPIKRNRNIVGYIDPFWGG